MRFFSKAIIKDGYVTLRGVDHKWLLKAIKKQQGDSRLINNMFVKGYFGLTFNEFFLPDVFNVIQKIHDKSSSVSFRYKANNILTMLKEDTWLANIDDISHPRLDLTNLSRMNYRPLDYQLEFLNYYSTKTLGLKLKGSLLAAAPGSGKTYTTLALGECLNADKIVVVCPLPAVVRAWEDNIQKVFKKEQSYWMSTFKHRYNNERIAVYHYEALSKAIEDIEIHNKSSKILVILDECHNLNEIKSLRTQLFLQLVKELNTNDIIFASGSPIKALGSEVIPLFRAIDPLFNEDAEQRFKKIYTTGSIQNAELLKARLGMVSFKVDKSAIDIDKPNLINQTIKIPNGDKYTLKQIKVVIEKYIAERNTYYDSTYKEDKQFYDECIDVYRSAIIKRYGTDYRVKEWAEFNQYLDFIEMIITAYKSKNLRSVSSEIEWTNKFERTEITPSLLPENKVRFKHVKSLIKYRGLKIQGEVLGRVVGRIRIEAHVDMVAYIDFETIVGDSEKKTVIFSSYIQVCEAAVEVLKKKGFKPLSVYGQFTKQLASIVASFEKDIELNPLVATYASLSTAVPLVMANTVILINPPFRTYIQEQAISRVHRLGATVPVFVYQTVLDTDSEPNISTRGVDILKWCQEQVSQLTGLEDIFKDATVINEDGSLTIANECLGITEVVNVDEVVYNRLQTTKSFLARW